MTYRWRNIDKHWSLWLYRDGKPERQLSGNYLCSRQPTRGETVAVLRRLKRYRPWLLETESMVAA